MSFFSFFPLPQDILSSSGDQRYVIATIWYRGKKGLCKDSAMHRQAHSKSGGVHSAFTENLGDIYAHIGTSMHTYLSLYS